MKRYLLDSNAIEMLVRKDPGFMARAMDATEEGGLLGTALPIVGEFLGGIEGSASVGKSMPKARRTLNKLKHWPFDFAAAVEYGRQCGTLRKRGITIQPFDLMAAAIALTIGQCTIVTSDSDFQRVPGLNVENWEWPTE
jgi:tRNA(fMet)-specific endonuclease VapC